MTESTTTGDENSALVLTHDISAAAIRNAVAIWSDATTNTSSPRRHDIHRDKQNAVLSFFTHVGKDLPDVTPLDVKSWQESLEEKGLARTTVYYRLCHLSSFYSWAQNHPTIGKYLTSNPVRLAHPKAPKAYQTESVKALTDKEFVALLSAVRNRAATDDVETRALVARSRAKRLDVVKNHVSGKAGGYWADLAVGWLEQGVRVDERIAREVYGMVESKRASQRRRHRAYRLVKRWERSRVA